MTNKSTLLFGLLLILCSVVLTARRDGISILQDQVVVTVHEGEFSVRKGCFSKNHNYYIKVTVGKHHKKTSTVSHSNGMPQWNERLYLNAYAYPDDHVMLVQLMDHHSVTPDRCLGHIKIHIHEFDGFTNQLTNNNLDMIGRVRLSIKRNTAQEDHHLYDLLGKDQPEIIQVVSNDEQNNEQPEIIERVSNDSFGITIADAQMYKRKGSLFSKQHYYVKVSVGGKLYMNTKSVKIQKSDESSTVDYCDWNELFTLNASPYGHELLIEVMGHDSFSDDVFLGSFKINTDEITDLNNDAFHIIYDAHDIIIGSLRLIIDRKEVKEDLSLIQ